MTPYATPLVAVEPPEVTRSGATTRVVARRTVRSTDLYLAGHFPDVTIYPGVFLLELARNAAVAAWAADQPDGADTPLPDVTAVRSARFLAPAGLGDEVLLDVVVARGADGTLMLEGCCARADGTVLAQLKLDLAVQEAVDAFPR